MKAVHEITIAAPAKRVYDLVADVTRWPEVFPPTVFVRRLETVGDTERIRIWATANGVVKNWTSRRRLDPAALRIEFRQEVSQHPVAAMGGTWHIEAVDDATTTVRLEHDFRAVDDDADNIAWITTAIDRNSDSELAALKAATEGEVDALTFEDTVEVTGAASDVYDFIYRADLWPDRLPHVARVDLREDTPNLQLLGMDTRTADGSVHTTESVRVCFPHAEIVYKQLKPPALLTVHLGAWRLTPTADGVTVTSTHTVVLNEANIAPILGAEATVADARAFVRAALSKNSTTTLGYAAKHAEQRAAE